MRSKDIEPRFCEICGKEYMPKRSDQRTCLSEYCMKERQKLNRIEYRKRNYGRVLEANRRAMEKKRAERYLRENPPKEDTIVAIGYAERQMADSLEKAGKIKVTL